MSNKGSSVYTCSFLADNKPADLAGDVGMLGLVKHKAALLSNQQWHTVFHDFISNIVCHLIIAVDAD